MSNGSFRAPERVMALLGLLAMASCSPKPKQESQAAIAPLPYNRASASEVFNLRSKCAELGRVLEEEDVHGPALNQIQASHYNPKTNRCFVQIDMMSNIENNPDRMTTLYDGQTKEILAYAGVRKGTPLAMNFALKTSDDPVEKNLSQQEQIQDAINAVMRDDREY